MKSSISAAVLFPVIVYMLASFALIGNYCKTCLSKSIAPQTLVNKTPKQTYTYSIDVNCMVFEQINNHSLQKTIPTPLKYTCSLSHN